MKIRSGFVSNSSSSSFIVGFYIDAVPKSAEELQKILFGNEEFVQAYDKSETTERVANTIFEDLQGQKPMTMQEILEEVEPDQAGGPSFEDVLAVVDPGKDRYDEDVNRDAIYAQLNLEQAKWSADYADKLMKSHPDKVFFKFDYGDESGPYESLLEHGDVFDRAPFHLRISRH